MVGGEPFSLKVFADLINSQNYEKVHILEPHSDVAGALINNLEEIFPYYLLKVNDYVKTEFGGFTLLAPDGGALKKIYKQAQIIKYNGDILCATKVRDVTNGKILKTEINANNEQIIGKNLIILDDICDGGRTFVELAKILKEKGAAKVILVIAHGIFSAGEDEMKKYIDKVYTTNSIKTVNSDLITTINL